MVDQLITSPPSLLKQAIKAVPAVKYALGVGGIVAVIVIIAGFKIDFRIAVFGVVTMFLLMTVLVVFAHIAGENKGSFRTPAIVFTWFAELMTMASALAVFTSVFWGHPANWTNLISVSSPPTNNRDLGKAETQTQSRTNSQASAIPAPSQKSEKPEDGPPVPSAPPKKSVPAVTKGVRKSNSRTQSNTVDSPCCVWLLGIWRGSVQRDYQKTDDYFTDYERPCEAKWTEIYELNITLDHPSEGDGTAYYSMPGAGIVCHTYAKRDGHEVHIAPESGGTVDPRSFHYPLKVSRTGIPNSARITVNGKDWILKKTSETQIRAVCLDVCDMTANTFWKELEPVKQIDFNKF
jgi:hypothetical protein